MKLFLISESVACNVANSGIAQDWIRGGLRGVEVSKIKGGRLPQCYG
jgi:hypothetical protein